MAEEEAIKRKIREIIGEPARPEPDVGNDDRGRSIVIENNNSTIGKIIIGGDGMTINLSPRVNVMVVGQPWLFHGLDDEDDDGADTAPADDYGDAEEEPVAVLMGAGDEWASPAARRVFERLSKGGGKLIELGNSSDETAAERPIGQIQTPPPDEPDDTPETAVFCGPIPPNPTWSRPIPDWSIQVSPYKVVSPRPLWERVG